MSFSGLRPDRDTSQHHSLCRSKKQALPDDDFLAPRRPRSRPGDSKMDTRLPARPDARSLPTDDSRLSSRAALSDALGEMFPLSLTSAALFRSLRQISLAPRLRGSAFRTVSGIGTPATKRRTGARAVKGALCKLQGPDNSEGKWSRVSCGGPICQLHRVVQCLHVQTGRAPPELESGVGSGQVRCPPPATSGSSP